jgi:hypothetical protein
VIADWMYVIVTDYDCDVCDYVTALG